MAGKVVYHYLAIGRLGRGEVVNLFLKDAGFEIEDNRYAWDHTWPATSKKLQEQGLTRTGLLPSIEYQGEVLTQHIPILRYFAREVGGYDGETNWEKYIVDAVSDIHIDWRFKFVANLKGATEEYKNEVVPKYYNLLAQYYAEREGPYLLGEKITYADFAVYQSIDNERRIGTLPSPLPEPLVKLEKAIEARPNIAEYIKANK
ncbi:glutathione S-transferase [Aspergillus lucknowensis]|uniref:Glutathione S-transferase n=1 Tax=Aspergillus lucknowensis TaxID=176173 RepID=A0ABR4M7B6_9EURO